MSTSFVEKEYIRHKYKAFRRQIMEKLIDIDDLIASNCDKDEFIVPQFGDKFLRDILDQTIGKEGVANIDLAQTPFGLFHLKKLSDTLLKINIFK